MTAAERIRSDLVQPPTRVTVTPRARRALTRICAGGGPQALLLSWPRGATCLPVGAFEPGAYDGIIGHVAGCAIHADLRQLDLYRDRSAIGDVAGPERRERPVILLREAVTDEVRQ